MVKEEVSSSFVKEEPSRYPVHVFYARKTRLVMGSIRDATGTLYAFRLALRFEVFLETIIGEVIGEVRSTGLSLKSRTEIATKTIAYRG